MYVKSLSDDEKAGLVNRIQKIKILQEQGTCFSCQNFITNDIFPDDGLIFYEDNQVRCQFEKYPKATGHTVIIAKDHYEDISEMPLELGIHILKVSDVIIKLHKEILSAEKVYMCTICDGKRNHLHFQLFPRLKGETIGFENFAREEGFLMDYVKTVEIYKERMTDIVL